MMVASRVMPEVMRSIELAKPVDHSALITAWRPVMPDPFRMPSINSVKQNCIA